MDLNCLNAKLYEFTVCVLLSGTAGVVFLWASRAIKTHRYLQGQLPGLSLADWEALPESGKLSVVARRIPVALTKELTFGCLPHTGVPLPEGHC